MRTWELRSPYSGQEAEAADNPRRINFEQKLPMSLNTLALMIMPFQYMTGSLDNQDSQSQYLIGLGSS